MFQWQQFLVLDYLSQNAATVSSKRVTPDAWKLDHLARKEPLRGLDSCTTMAHKDFTLWLWSNPLNRKTICPSFRRKLFLIALNHIPTCLIELGIPLNYNTRYSRHCLIPPVVASIMSSYPECSRMPWQSAPPLAIITLAMGAVSGLMSLTNYLTVGRTDRLIGLDEFDYMWAPRCLLQYYLSMGKGPLTTQTDVHLFVFLAVIVDNRLLGPSRGNCLSPL